MYRGIEIRLVFMGTPDFAVPTLRTLVEHAPPGLLWAGGLDIVGVITQPDRPSGRGQRTAMSAVKEAALAHGLRVLEPETLRSDDTQKMLRALAPDVIIVAAYGQILPKAVLDLPKYGCLNVHGSLLPRYRGASPVAGAILAGEHETGVTVMLMDAGLDTGPMLARRALTILDDENAGSLTDRLAVLGAGLLRDTLPVWLAGGIAPEPQNDALATMTRPLRKSDGRLDWTRPAEQLARAVRAYTPWPGAFTTYEGRVFKVLAAEAMTLEPPVPVGTCFLANEDGRDVLACACGQGALALQVVQLEGKRALPADDVLRGHPDLAHATLGTNAAAS